MEAITTSEKDMANIQDSLLSSLPRLDNESRINTGGFTAGSTNKDLHDGLSKCAREIEAALQNMAHAAESSVECS